MADFDLAAINDRGVYAICHDDGSNSAREFAAEVIAEGGTIQRLPRREACDRLLDYLKATWPAFAVLYDDPARPLALTGEGQR